MNSLLQDFCQAYMDIEADLGGGSPLYKTYLMAYLADLYKLDKYVEIGIYKGKSLFPMAQVMKRNKGKAIGIDPYDKEAARERDLDPDKSIIINKFIDYVNFNELYAEVLTVRDKLKLDKTCTIIRKTSENAILTEKKQLGNIGMLHIDGNHDSKYVSADCDSYIPLVHDGGYVVIDDIDWDSVRPIYEKYKEDLISVYEDKTFGILLKEKKDLFSIEKAERLNKKICFLREKISDTEQELRDGAYFNKRTTVGIGVLTYNHELFIEECLDGVFSQKGNYNATVIIIDDCSTDDNLSAIYSYLEAHSWINSFFNVRVIANKTNLGVTPSFKKLINELNGFDYATIVEGDDYWTNPYRVQMHIDYLLHHPECAISFNYTKVFDETTKAFVGTVHDTLTKSIYTTEDLIENYVIGNESCAFYDGRILPRLPDSLFDLFIGDWMFNTFCSTFGDIGFINQPSGVYRYHTGGVWSKLEPVTKVKSYIKNVHTYNMYTNFSFDPLYSECVERTLQQLSAVDTDESDVIIVDDIFPLPASGFRYQEFTSYLENIKNIRIFCTTETIEHFSDKSSDEVIIDYKRMYPHYSDKIIKYTKWLPVNTKLFYFIFPTNASNHLPLAEQTRTPFIFTLYPGGGFWMGNADSDARLRRLFDSPCFRKVIVTQQVTYDYLISRNLCRPEQIAFIFGGVMPLRDEGYSEKYTKLNYGFEKDRMDICFIAQRYTEKGEDKGYDLFVEAAKRLCKNHDNIYFHVVGSFTEDILDVSDIKDRIRFYGIIDIGEFDEFLRNKDLILSPNINNIITNGAFDGFPTGSCVEAGLRKTAVFCTDPLGLCGGRFEDKKEIVIIEHDFEDIVSKIEYYYTNYEELRQIGLNGEKKFSYIYSFEYQILPRIELLKEEAATPLLLSDRDFKILEHKYRYSRPKYRLLELYRKCCPLFIKKAWRAVKRIPYLLSGAKGR